jgi:2-polyprenyl-3-methyl-5-hydroxy-6-metoxy-1,4-benzoquinol methylase
MDRSPGTQDGSRTNELKAQVVQRYGEWTAHNIHLAGDLYTMGEYVRGDEILARRVLQVASDLTGQSLKSLRVLDLACLEGLYAIEFARQGAEVVGVEIREANLERARFVKQALGLERLELAQDDVRNLSKEAYGDFDVVLCLGILYHLDAPDVFDFVYRMAEVCRRCLIIDTHISTTNEASIEYAGRQYAGKYFIEHDPQATPEQKLKMVWASIDNDKSFWLTRASLDNLLAHAGFTSVYEVHNPTVQKKFADRLTLVAIKGEPQSVVSSPLLGESVPSEWSEHEDIQEFQGGRPVASSLLRRLGSLAPGPVKNVVRKFIG